MVCIWSLQTCYMHACIKSAYMRVNLSGHAPSHASWTHAYWHGHTLACSVVYRVMHTCVHQPLCIWSLQICYMHACIKSAYMRVNLSGHTPSHTSWTHAYWHGHTLACSVVYRGYAHMYASASMHLEPTDLLHARVDHICIYVCECKRACAFPRVLDARTMAWAHTGLQCCAWRLMHTCVHNLCTQHCRPVCAHASMRASRTRGKACAHLNSHAYMQI